MGDRLDALIGATACLHTANLLYQDEVMTSSRQAMFWEQRADEMLEPLVDPAARALVAAMFGGLKFGYTPDNPFVQAHVDQNTQEWKLARHYAKIAILGAGLVDPISEQAL